MNKLTAVCLAALTATAALAADALPTFNATLTVGKESRFVLLGPDGKASSWLKLGDTFDGYTLKSYDPKNAALDLEKDGQTAHVTLAADAAVAAGAAGTASSHQGTLQDATAVLDAMHFETMLDQTLKGVRQNQIAMVRQMMGKMTPKGVDREDLIAFQQKVMETMMSGLNAADLKDDVAKVYSEVFSKEQLEQLAGFYSSPLGQALAEKTPELTQKMNQVMMPRMMANLPKVQQMAQEFAMEQDAKHRAANPTPAATPAAPTAPAAGVSPKP